MPDWFGGLLVAVGGGVTAATAMLTIFKGLLLKFFEESIESSFEKKIEKFKNKLERRTRAYEMLLDREMRCYEKMDPLVAEIIPLEHDLRYFLERHEGIEREKECERFREHFRRYGELIITMKNENLVSQSYVPKEIFEVFGDVVTEMQDEYPFWREMGELLFAGEYDKIDYKRSEEMVKVLLMKLAVAGLLVKKRLAQLGGEED